MKTERNWEAIRQAYETGEAGLGALAKKNGIPATTLYARARREGWCVQQAEAPLSSARDCVDLLLRAVRESLNCDDALQSTCQVKCKSKQDGPDGPVERNWTEEEPTGRLDIGKVREYAVVLDDLISLKRDLYDLPNGTETERRKLAREKLEMARQKLAPAQPQALQVLFTDEAADWAE